MTFGEFAVLDDAPRSASAEAITDVRAYVIERDAFRMLLQTHFALVERVIALLTQRLRYTTTYAEQLLFFSVLGRLAARLVQLADELSPSDPVTLQLTQQELAEFVGTSREWTNRALHQLAGLELIRIDRGAVTVLDRQGLLRQVY